MFVSLYCLQTSVYLSKKVYPIAKSPEFGAFLFGKTRYSSWQLTVDSWQLHNGNQTIDAVRVSALFIPVIYVLTDVAVAVSFGDNPEDFWRKPGFLPNSSTKKGEKLFSFPPSILCASGPSSKLI